MDRQASPQCHQSVQRLRTEGLIKPIASDLCRVLISPRAAPQNVSVDREEMMHRWSGSALLALMLVAAPCALAQEVALKGITAFAEKTLNSRGFERFIEIVNTEGKGKLRIDYIGGPKAMPPF